MGRENGFGSAELLVCDRVRGWILDGTLVADEEINQTEIANRLGVSRIPVRDALRRLEATGLVTIRPNRRAVVTSFTLADMYEIFEIRAALEGLAARHAVANLKPSDLIELESLAQVMLRVTDLETYLAKHEDFHDLIGLRSGMPRLRDELTRLREMATPYIRIYGAAHRSAELTEDRHEMLLKVLRLRDPDQAQAAFAGHTRSAYEQHAAAVLRLTKDGGDGRPGRSEGGRAQSRRSPAGLTLDPSGPDGNATRSDPTEMRMGADGKVGNDSRSRPPYGSKGGRP